MQATMKAAADGAQQGASLAGTPAVHLWWATADTLRSARNAALQQCWSGLGGAGVAPEIQDHAHFCGHPEWALSLTHSRDLAIVAAAPAAAVRGLGVDLEYADRELRPGVARHLLHTRDAPPTAENLLRTWVLKEAAFKALDPLRAQYWGDDTPLVLSQLWLDGASFGARQRAAVGYCRIAALRWQGRSVLLGWAWIGSVDALDLRLRSTDARLRGGE